MWISRILGFVNFANQAAHPRPEQTATLRRAKFSSMKRLSEIRYLTGE